MSQLQPNLEMLEDSITQSDIDAKERERKEFEEKQKRIKEKLNNLLGAMEDQKKDINKIQGIQKEAQQGQQEVKQKLDGIKEKQNDQEKNQEQFQKQQQERKIQQDKEQRELEQQNKKQLQDLEQKIFKQKLQHQETMNRIQQEREQYEQDKMKRQQQFEEEMQEQKRQNQAKIQKQMNENYKQNNDMISHNQQFLKKQETMLQSILQNTKNTQSNQQQNLQFIKQQIDDNFKQYLDQNGENLKNLNSPNSPYKEQQEIDRQLLLKIQKEQDEIKQQFFNQAESLKKLVMLFEDQTKTMHQQYTQSQRSLTNSRSSQQQQQQYSNKNLHENFKSPSPFKLQNEFENDNNLLQQQQGQQQNLPPIRVPNPNNNNFRSHNKINNMPPPQSQQQQILQQQQQRNQQVSMQDLYDQYKSKYYHDLTNQDNQQYNGRSIPLRQRMHSANDYSQFQKQQQLKQKQLFLQNQDYDLYDINNNQNIPPYIQSQNKQPYAHTIDYQNIMNQYQNDQAIFNPHLNNNYNLNKLRHNTHSKYPYRNSINSGVGGRLNPLSNRSNHQIQNNNIHNNGNKYYQDVHQQQNNNLMGNNIMNNQNSANMGLMIEIDKVSHFPRGQSMSIEIYFLDESGIVLDDYNKPLYVISSDEFHCDPIQNLVFVDKQYQTKLNPLFYKQSNKNSYKNLELIIKIMIKPNTYGGNYAYQQSNHINQEEMLGWIGLPIFDRISGRLKPGNFSGNLYRNKIPTKAPYNVDILLPLQTQIYFSVKPKIIFNQQF